MQEEVKDFIPEPEGIEKLAGMERTDVVIDTAEIQQEIPKFDPRERAEKYYKGMQLSRDEYRAVKKMDREKMQGWLNHYVAQRTQQGMSLYAEIMLGQYLEVLTSTLKDKFNFTEEQIEELNKAVEAKTNPTETGTDESGNPVEIEVVE